jgi:hypothetical protein
MSRGDTVTMRRYLLDSEEPWGGWGIIWLSDDGLFAARSDYGDYIHYWPSRHRGESWADMRQFALQVEPGYLMGKLGKRDQYDAEPTLLGVKRHILESRRNNWMTSEEAKCEWVILKECCYLASEEDFRCWLEETEIGDAWEMCSRTYPSDLKAFAHRLMPRLRELIKQELATESMAANPLLKLEA